MSKQLVQTIYIPTRVEDELPEKEVIAKNISDDFLVGYIHKISDDDYWCEDDHQRLAQTTHWLKPKEGIFSTVEEYNKHIKEVIEETLTKASEFAELEYECGNKTKKNCLAVFCRNCNEQISRDSILNTFEQSYKKFKI